MISTWIYLDRKTDCHHQAKSEDGERHRCCCCWWNLSEKYQTRSVG